MSIQSVMFNLMASRSDKKRDDAIPIPEGVVQCRDLHYRGKCEHHLMDVYYPEGTEGTLPTIVSIHGGGYVYGSKEIYRRYCMDLARRGFAVVNFNYRLAPRWKFPVPMVDTNYVMEWICAHGKEYHLDPQRMFVVGDSAGAQLASQYAAIWANEAYAAHFGFKVPAIRILALGLNCGLYDMFKFGQAPRKGLAADYLSADVSEDDPRLGILDAIAEGYPPAYIITAEGDYLRDNAQPMCELLQQRGIDSSCRIYGSKEEPLGHVFHVNILLPEAVRCNDDQCAFFRKYL